MQLKNLIDCHQLVGTDYWLSRNKLELAHQNDLGPFKDFSKAYNVACKAHIFPFPSSEDSSYRKENLLIQQIALENTDFIPVFAFNPHSAESYHCVMDCLDCFSMAGIVIWPILCDVNLTDLRSNVFFRDLCNREKVWVTVHVGTGNEAKISRVIKTLEYSPMDAISLAESFPNTRFNLAQ